MAWVEKFANFDLATGLDNGTSEANAWKTIASLNAALLPGERVNIKRQATAYQITGAGVVIASFAPTTAATMSNPIAYRGYASTIGDGGYWTAHLDASTYAALDFAQNYSIVENVETTINQSLVSGRESLFRSAPAFWFGINLKLALGSGQSKVGSCIGCYFEHYGTKVAGGGNSLAVLGINQASSSWHRCFARRMPGSSYNQTGIPFFIVTDTYDHMSVFDDCLIIGNGQQEDGIFFSRNDNARGPIVSNCSFYNFGNGISLSGNALNSRYLAQITNNIFSTMGGYAVKRLNDINPWGDLIMRRNAYHNCTSGFSNYDNKFADDNLALSASPYTDPSTNDYTLNNLAGGGALLRAESFNVDPTDANSMVTRAFAQYAQAGAVAATKSFFG